MHFLLFMNYIITKKQKQGANSKLKNIKKGANIFYNYLEIGANYIKLRT